MVFNQLPVLLLHLSAGSQPRVHKLPKLWLIILIDKIVSFQTETVGETIEECIKQGIGVCNTAMASQRLIHGGPCLYATILSKMPLVSPCLVCV